METTERTNPKRSLGYLLGLCLAMLGANFVWTSYNTFLLPTLVEEATPALKGLVTGLITFFGTLVAVFISILTGIITDRVASRWGKRIPSLLIGSLLAFPFIILAAIFYPPAIYIIIISYVGMQFFTNIANGAWWPLLVDVVPEEQRGTASGINGGYALFGAILAFGVVSFFNGSGHTDWALWLIAAVFIITTLANVLVIRRDDRPAPKGAQVNLWTNLRNMFKVRTVIVVFFWLTFASFLANMGINSMQVFARYFFQVYFPAMNPDTALAIMGGVSILLTIAAAIASGVLSDKFGRRRIIMIGMFLAAVMTLLMGLTDNFYLFLVVAAIRSAATGPIVAVIPALSSDLAPKDEAGQYMAYANLATGLSGAISGLVFGVILIEISKMGFIIMFMVAALFFLAGGLFFQFKVPQVEIDRHLNTTPKK
jgi:MFS family permease